MPLFFTQHLRGLTLALFTLLDAEGEDSSALQQLFDRSEEKQKSIFTRDDAINLLGRACIRGINYNTEFRNITCLDVAILKRKKNYVAWLAEKIFKHPTLRQTYKQDIFISAICICCTINQNEILKYLIRAYTFNLDQGNHYWDFNRTNLALNMAVSVANTDAVSLLLSHGASKQQIDKNYCRAEDFLKNISLFDKRKKMREILNCRDYIAAALDFYQQNNLAKFQEWLIRAIKADMEQVYYYLLNINNPHPAMLLDLMQVLLKIPLQHITYDGRNRFELFQSTVLSRLLPANANNEILIEKINAIFPTIKLA